MPRGIPWDELPNVFTRRDTKDTIEQQAVRRREDARSREKALETLSADQNLTFSQAAESIGRRVAFGGVCGGLTGAAFGFVEVLRSPALLAGKQTLSKTKVITYATRFGGFFAVYHGTRRVLKLYTENDVGTNATVAALMCLTPLAVIPKMRVLLPYGIAMVAIDAFNGLDD